VLLTNCFLFKGDALKIPRLLVELFVIALFASLSLSRPAFAQDGGAIFKAKCASCHGPEGQGKTGPKLQGDILSSAQIDNLLTKGDDSKKAPHKKAFASLSADDAKAVAVFVKTLK
jgi:mono/diheme cytochrome c family protein